MVGIFYYYLADLARRKSFSETRRYMKALITIEGTKSRKVRPICNWVGQSQDCPTRVVYHVHVQTVSVTGSSAPLYTAQEADGHYG